MAARKFTDDELLEALAATGSVARAARKLGVTGRACYERLRDEKLAQQWRDLRTGKLEHDLAEVYRDVPAALRAMRSIRQHGSQTEGVRLGAATKTVQFAIKLRELELARLAGKKTDAEDPLAGVEFPVLRLASGGKVAE
jgi:DNA-binding transcriptional LysR family regulator